MSSTESATAATAEAVARGRDLVARVLERTRHTRVVHLDEEALTGLGALLRAAHGAAPVVWVADETTWSVAGDAAAASVADAGLTEAGRIVLPARPRPYANIGLVHRVRDALVAALADHPGAVPVAVGAGTINDVVKLAAAELDTPYWVVGTAPSMDGYTAFGASISVDGFKQNLPCPAPYGVVLDLDVLATAPPVMWASGLGDMIGKISACADWRIAEAAGVEPVDAWTWELVSESLVDALADPPGVGRRERPALASLTVGLVMSGLSIQAYSSSRPGSGAEHMFSHLWEMEGVGVQDDPPLSHGAKVGVGSVAVAALYDELLRLDLDDVDPAARARDWPALEEALAELPAAHGDSPVLAAARSQLPRKYPTPDQLADRLGRVRRVWPELRADLRALMRPAARVRADLEAAGAVHHPARIGLTRESFRADHLRLRTTRERYTSLDLAAEAGLLPGLVDRLFAPGGFWAIWPAAP